MMLETITRLCALLTCGLIVSVSTIKPGLEQVNPPRGSENECLESELTFRCTTTGRGTTVLSFNGTELFRFRHSRYTPDSPNQNDNQDDLDGEIRAGNLLLSSSEQCFNSRHNSSDCYTTSLVVRISNRTMCGIIVCRTIFRPDTGPDESEEFGRDYIARSVPSPASLNVSVLSLEEITVTWEAGTSANNCSAITYDSVTSSNCGSCSPVMTRDSFMYVTCMDPVAGQICNISVRSMLECGVYSNPRMLEVKVPESEANPMDIDNRAAIGIGVGVVAVILVVGVIVVLSVYFVRRKSPNRDFEPVPKGTPGHVQEAESSLNGTKVVSKDDVEKVSADEEPLLNKTENSLNNTKVESVGDVSIIEQQPVPPSDSTSKDGKGECDIGSKTNAAPLQAPVLSIEHTVSNKMAELVPGLNSVGIPSQHDGTDPASSRDIPVTVMMEPSLQTFNTSVEKGSRNAGAASSLVAGGESLVPKNGQEPPKQSEGGKLLSQKRAHNDSEGGVTAKNPVVVSDSEGGPSQTVAIKGKGAQFTAAQIVGNGSGEAPKSDALSMLDKRVTDLEIEGRQAKREREELKRENQEKVNQLKRENQEKIDQLKRENQEKIDQLTAEISDLREQFKIVKAKYEKESEDEIEDLEQELAAARTRIKELEDENTSLKIPKKSFSTDTSGSETKPEFLRSKSRQ